jgi:hypothetical protein
VLGLSIHSINVNQTFLERPNTRPTKGTGLPPDRVELIVQVLGPLIGSRSGEELAPVWADDEGSVRGESIEPLYPSAPRAAREDPKLYELLALVDALRIGRARERKLAEALLRQRLAA